MTGVYSVVPRRRAHGSPTHTPAIVNYDERLIDREQELALLARRMAEGGRVRLAAPRGYGKTTLAEAALAQAREQGALAVRVDLYGVTSRMTLCSRIEEAFERELSGAGGAWTKVKAKLARRGGGMQLPAGLGGAQLGPEDTERRLLDALDLPGQLADTGQVVVCYDEFQEVLRAGGAERDRRGRPRPGGLDAVIRSVTQRHGNTVGYLFCGSGRPFRGALIDPLFERWITEGRRWPYQDPEP